MKKIFCVLLVFLLCFSLSSCNTDEKTDADPYTDKLRQTASDIVRCFDDKNIEELSKLISQSSHDKYYIETQIKEAFEFYSGKSVKFTAMNFQREGLMMDFEDVQRYYDPMINVETDTGKKYRIYFQYYFADKDIPDNIGVTFIKLFESVTDQQDELQAYIGGDISANYEYTGGVPFTRKPEYTNAIKNQ